MSNYGRESDLVAYCGIYCRLCDYFSGKIRASARDLLEVAKKHSELRFFADTSKAFDCENFMKGLEWISTEMTPCVGGCRGGGGWGDCPIRNCCMKKGLRARLLSWFKTTLSLKAAFCHYWYVIMQKSAENLGG